MWSRFQRWIVVRWLVQSEMKIIEKKNGYTNIQITHPQYGILVAHPVEEKGKTDSKDGFFPLIGYQD